MGIEIPEEYGGGGGTFFEAILAVEELSKVDASAGVIVDVQNTLCNNALLRWGTPEQKKKYLPKQATEWVGAYALSEAASGSDAFALQTKAELKGDEFILNGRKLWITNGKEASLFIMIANINPAAGYKGITAFLVEKDMPGFTVGKKEDKLGIRASSTCELIMEDCHVPKANVLGEVGKGYKIAIETLNEGRIGIGAQMLGRCRRRVAVRDEVRAGTQTVRQAHLRFPGDPVPAGANGDRDRSRQNDGLQRGAHEGCRNELCERSCHDQAVRLAGRRARHFALRGNLRRIRLRERLSGREVFPRLEDRQDLRRHVQHATGYDRQAGGEVKLVESQVKIKKERLHPVLRRCRDGSYIMNTQSAQIRTARDHRSTRSQSTRTDANSAA